MATLIDSAEFSANEIYEIAATDPVEGAATGASFSGIGVSNEPHQQLANRTAFLYGRQNTNIANIAALLARNTWLNAQTYIAGGASGPFTVPAGVYWVRIICVGGGGGGLNSAAGSPGSVHYSGPGGGAGAYAEGIYAVTPGQQFTVTVGAGGAAGADGGTSSAGSFLQATGGHAGGWGAGPSGAGGAGGAASGGTIANFGGGARSDGMYGSLTFAGNGAPGPWGGGGRAAGYNAANNPAAIQSGAAPGAGGGGGYAGQSGGAAAAGCVIVEW